MDQKEQELISDLHKRILKNKFDEKDIYSFLILLRSYAPKNSPVKEFGDFIAHREKDRGFIKEYLLRTQYAIDNLGKINTVLKIKPVFTTDEIKESLNKILSLQKLETFSDETIEKIILFIISLLQDVNIYDKKRKYIGKLQFSISKDEITLVGKVETKKKASVIFPVLTIKNLFQNNITSTFPKTIEKIVKIILINGVIKIELTSYDTK